jgi:WD40 repeat protein
VEGAGIFDQDSNEIGDKMVRIFDYRNSQPEQLCRTPNLISHNEIKISPCGNLFAVCGLRGSNKSGVSNETLVFDLRNVKKPLSVLNYDVQLEKGVDSILWSNAGTLYSGDPDGCVRLWNVHQGEIIKVLTGPDGSIKNITLSDGF